MELIWTPRSLRSFKRPIRRNPQLRSPIEKTLRQLIADPFAPSLRSHKLKGEFSRSWSCSIDYNHRIRFEFIKHPDKGTEAILILNLGDHDSIYE